MTAPEPKPMKPVKAWAAVDPKGTVWGVFTARPYAEWYKTTYRCRIVRVLVQEVPRGK